jgi:hypothetical protein
MQLKIISFIIWDFLKRLKAKEMTLMIGYGSQYLRKEIMNVCLQKKLSIILFFIYINLKKKKSVYNCKENYKSQKRTMMKISIMLNKH